MTDDPDQLLSVAQVAQRLGMAESTVHKLVSKGQWPHLRLPGRGGWRYAFTLDQLEQILAQHTVTPIGFKGKRKAS